MASKSIITIATGKKAYIDMACNLAMSFLLWNDPSAIKFFLITDRAEFVPEKLKQQIDVITISMGELGDGFSTKLHMDRFAFTKQVLFIDADCLVYGSLEFVFANFNGRTVSVIGHKQSVGKDIGFCTDIATLMANMAIPYYIMLCGSVYYFESGKTATEIFDYARTLLPQYYKIGLISLRGKENEEPLMAIAMAKFNQEPITDTGLVKADRMYYEFIDTNVLKGKAMLWNTDTIPVPDYSTLKTAMPAIVHFNASYADIFEYRSEEIRLKQVFLKKNPAFIANIYATIFSVLPGKLVKTTKIMLRPLYHSLFGYRKIKQIRRLQ